MVEVRRKFIFIIFTASLSLREWDFEGERKEKIYWCMPIILTSDFLSFSFLFLLPLVFLSKCFSSSVFRSLLQGTARLLL